jgi:hypothetical protein
MNRSRARVAQAGSDAVHPGEFAGPAIWDQLTQAGVS